MLPRGHTPVIILKMFWMCVLNVLLLSTVFRVHGADFSEKKSKRVTFSETVTCSPCTVASPSRFDDPSPVPVLEPFNENMGLGITVEWVKNFLIPHFKNGGTVGPVFFKNLVYAANSVLSSDETIHGLFMSETASLYVVGDIHGEFDAMVDMIFEPLGYPGEDLFYIFNGDLVDYGSQSVECIITTLALKVAARTRFFITRGNHESDTVRSGTFIADCAEKLKRIPDAFATLQILFRSLPVGYIVNRRTFVAHGGLCPGMNLNSIRVANRTSPGFTKRLDVLSLLWNDPAGDDVTFDEYGMAPSSRGPGVSQFSADVTHQFLQNHNLSLFVRGHQYAEKGYQFNHGNKCLTIFSAPNYKGRGNEGALLLIRRNQVAKVVRMKRSEEK